MRSKEKTKERKEDWKKWKGEGMTKEWSRIKQEVEEGMKKN